MSIQVLGQARLDQLQVQAFDDYVRFLPSVTYQTAGPGSARVYFRGVSSGENANHSSSQPTVGIYLDEQPITTIQGALDIHLYDIARVEALAGPQGTLYGSSSEAGTIRIITNKPDPSKFSGAFDFEVNKVTDGEFGYVAEGFVNVPLSDKIAVRAVGWYDKDAGFIDNVLATRRFPVSGILATTAPFVEDDYNDVETYGGRIALGIELDDSWTITPAIMGQKQRSDGFFGQESGRAKKRQVAQFNPEFNTDDWYQASLTIEGKVGDWSLTYAGAYLKRNIDGISDYSDYSYFYDALNGSGAYICDNAGNLVSPNQYIISKPRFTKQSHEFRIASPADKRLRLIAGLFYQRQKNGIEENYIIDNIADIITVKGTDSNIWLTKQVRVDRDYAVFGELAYDITDKLTLTAGTRVYKYDNSLVGFFGYAAGFSSRTGEAACFNTDGTTRRSNPAGTPVPNTVAGAPCINLDRRTKDTDWLPKVNLTYKINDDALVYATFSRGFRPGGINRRGTVEPYAPDVLDNYELGFKTSFADNKVRFNGAIYQLDWDDVQFSSLGENGLTIIRNAGNARIRGFEFDLNVQPTTGLTLGVSGSYNNAKLVTDFCASANSTQDCTIPGPGGAANSVLAPAGTRLPDTARFKGNAVARYEVEVRDGIDAHIQGAVVREGKRLGDLRPATRAIVGDFPGYTTVDLSVGFKTGRFSAELYGTNIFDVNGQTSRSVQCGESICGDPDGVTASGGIFYTYVIRPRTIGLKVGTKF
ncbi:TonB-dependent receptor [Glacieibacterium frigidum]|uniref:TonB-dependent receptor n=2 Tax=Glacieibacterium frigidum TaxID=2593303 RepID=A0A552UJG9_9SPHN|nr:TonB-dependent receptor [Glacieibacterium frigidum]